jgi:hypothetical protein
VFASRGERRHSHPRLSTGAEARVAQEQRGCPQGWEPSPVRPSFPTATAAEPAGACGESQMAGSIVSKDSAK